MGRLGSSGGASVGGRDVVGEHSECMSVCVLDEIGGTEMRREEEKIGPCGAAGCPFVLLLFSLDCVESSPNGSNLGAGAACAVCQCQEQVSECSKMQCGAAGGPGRSCAVRSLLFMPCYFALRVWGPFHNTFGVLKFGRYVHVLPYR